MTSLTNTGSAHLRGGWVIIAFLLTGSIWASGPTHTDEIFVVRNHALIFELPGSASATTNTIQLYEAPLYGTVLVNEDQSIPFTPQRDVCEVQDKFLYQYKAEDGVLQTVEIRVEILCEALTVISNFSPDGDERNDFFTILGIQNYPGNKLTVFDSQGGEVFSQSNYQNDWDGTGQTGEALAGEGTVYYYVLTDGMGKNYSGILTID